MKKDLLLVQIQSKTGICLICPYCKFLEISKYNIYNLDTSIPIKILQKLLYCLHDYLELFFYRLKFDPIKELDYYTPKIFHTTTQLEGLKRVTKPLLVLDLDNCLLYGDCSNDYNDPDLYIELDGYFGKDIVHVYFRSYLEYFLNTVSKEFDLAVFTNGIKKYANTISDYLRKFVDIKAVLYRENCSYYNGKYVKDLRLFGDMEDIFILDNDLLVSILQPEKLININTWYLSNDKNKSDTELFKVANFLVKMAKRGVKYITKSLRIKALLELQIG